MAAWASVLLPLLFADATPGSAQLLPRDFALPTPLFASDSAWNQTAAGAAVLPNSDRQILVLYRVLLGDSSGLHPPGTRVPSPFPFMFVNHAEYTVPVSRLGGAQQKVSMRGYDGTARAQTNPKLPVAPDGTVTVPAPAGTVRPSGPQSVGADGHLVLYDPATSTAYDFWNATTARNALGQSLGGGQPGTTILEAGAIDVFDTRGAGANPRTYASARATGTPLLAGLLLPEDVERGTIDHALAFAIPGPRNTNTATPSEPYPSDYFYPASTTEAEFFNSDPQALAAGQRLRLKQSLVGTNGNPIDQATLAPITRMFLAALRTHGAYLVDNAGGLAFYAEDINTAVLNLTPDQVNALIGQPPGTPLPAGKTKWQVVIETLNQQLEGIPVAAGPPVGDPGTATFDVSNFDVVGPASRTPGDFDGDRAADVAVYRGSTGEWFVRRSSDGGLMQIGWGAPVLADAPAPADYDGDGRTDVAVYRGSTGEWFVRRSSDGGLMQVGWGSPVLADAPVPADFDGDGRTDIAVYRQATGEWFIRPSSINVLVQIAWGAPALGDVPVPADYDGDGATDLGVYRATTGEWLIRPASTGALVRVPWGSPFLGDTPVPADFDGDGVADVAVYRRTTGEWYIRRSGDGGLIQLRWGSPFLGDTPVPA